MYCTDCVSAVERGRSWCQLHADGSPVTRFSRIRKVQVRMVGNELYEIFCSCLFQPTYGIPCQHLVALMPAILPHHVSVRWHTDIALNYQKNGDATRRFNHSKNRVLITRKELCDVISNAQSRQEMYKWDLPVGFWDNHCIVHQPYGGTIAPLGDGANDVDPTFYPDDNSLMRTETGLSQSLQEGNGDTTIPLSNSNLKDALIALQDTVQRSSDYYFLTQSIQRRLCDMVRMIGKSAAEEMLLKRFADMQKLLTADLLTFVDCENANKRHFSGTMVSSNLPFDTRRIYKRIKSSSERSATSKEVERKNHPFQLSKDSIMRTFYRE